MFALVEYKSAVIIETLWLSKFHKESNTKAVMINSVKECISNNNLTTRFLCGSTHFQKSYIFFSFENVRCNIRNVKQHYLKCIALLDSAVR